MQPPHNMGQWPVFDLILMTDTASPVTAGALPATKTCLRVEMDVPLSATTDLAQVATCLKSWDLTGLCNAIQANVTDAQAPGKALLQAALGILKPVSWPGPPSGKTTR
jgi:hypothetical protein